MHDIDKFFPYKNYRPLQRETIQFAIDNIEKGKKFIIIEAPTGSGKSGIGLTLSRMYGPGYILTITKQLQDQITAEFGESGSYGHLMVDLKGRNAYPCEGRLKYADEYLLQKRITKAEAKKWKENYYNCAQGVCRKADVKCMEKCECPYQAQVDKAIASHTCMMNFAGFLCQTTYTKRFNKRRIMVIDEAHNIESQLMGFVSFEMNDESFDIKFPKYDKPELYAQWFIEQDMYTKIMSLAIIAENNDDANAADKWKTLADKLTRFLSEITQSNTEWVVETTDINNNLKVVFKPVFVHEYAYKYLFDHADIIIMMSATILDVNVLARSLGIAKAEIAAKRLPNYFPVINRPIYYKPAVKVTGGDAAKSRWGPPLIKAVNELARKYGDKRGIVHTHNFSIAKMLMAECAHDVAGRFLFQENYTDKTQMLMAHEQMSNSILVAPAMHEGIDLKDDLSRFQILCKVPFPNFYEDKQLSVRKEVDPEFYDWLVALKIVQSVGRSIRSETDWADTYIIDASFEWWFKRNQSILPKWFKEAVKGIILV